MRQSELVLDAYQFRLQQKPDAKLHRAFINQNPQQAKSFLSEFRPGLKAFIGRTAIEFLPGNRMREL